MKNLLKKFMNWLEMNIWKCTPDGLLQGRGCSKCNNRYKRTHEEFIKDVENINDKIEVLDKFVSVLKKVKCKCLIDGHIWDVRCSALLNGSSCPKCAGKLVTHEEFIEKMNVINNNIMFLSKYVNSYSKLKCKCLIDNNAWEATPDNLLQGYGCPKCNQSKGEKKTGYILKQNDLPFEFQYKIDECKNINSLPFDFAIFKDIDKINLIFLIEYQGIQHYEPVELFGGMEQFILQQKLDNIKRNYCKLHSIKLIEISYWDYDNIEEILKRELNC